MKVLLIVSTYPNKKSTAGNFYLRTAEALVKIGVEVCVISFVPKTFPLMAKISPKWDEYRHIINHDEIINGVRVVRLGYFGLPMERIWAWPHFSMFKSAKDFIETNKLQFDIIDANYAFPYCVVGEKLAAYFDKPVIATLRGSDVNIDAYRSEMGKHRFISGIRLANRIHVVSHALKLKVESIYPNKRTSVFPIGLDFSLIHELKNAVPAKHSFNSKAKCDVVFVGSLTYLKGIDLLIEAIADSKFSNINWHFIGIGPYVAELSKYENVNLHMHLKYETTLFWMNSSDLLVLPSRGEGMPNVIKEAGALNVPVLASDVGGIPELLNDGQFGTIFKSGDVEDFKHKLNIVLNNYNEALEKAKLLHDYVSDNYDINRNTIVLKEIYRKEITE